METRRTFGAVEEFTAESGSPFSVAEVLVHGTSNSLMSTIGKHPQGYRGPPNSVLISQHWSIRLTTFHRRSGVTGGIGLEVWPYVHELGPAERAVARISIDCSFETCLCLRRAQSTCISPTDNFHFFFFRKPNFGCWNTASFRIAAARYTRRYTKLRGEFPFLRLRLPAECMH